MQDDEERFNFAANDEEERFNREQSRIETNIVGTKYFDLTKVKVGKLDLVPEPSNPHDPGAVKVMQGFRQIGYLPKGLKSPRFARAKLWVVGYPWAIVITSEEI